MASIRDIAKAASVSIATVSRALSGSPEVSEELAKKVRAAAASLNYRPERARRGKRPRTQPGPMGSAAPRAEPAPRVPGGAAIQLYVPGTRAAALHDRSVGYFAYVFSGMLRKAEEAGLSLNLTPYPVGKIAEVLHAENLERMRRAGVLGLLFLFSSRDEEKLLAAQPPDFPWIALNRAVPNAGLSVRIDERAGAKLGVEHLIEAGHTRIAVLAGPASFSFFEERLAGVKDALSAHGLNLPAELLVRAELSLEAGRVAAHKLLTASPRPTALFACEEDFAAAALAEAERMALRIPEDLSLVAFSDFVLSAKKGAGVTAVSTPAFELGYMAVETLLNQHRLSAPMRAELVLAPKLIVRHTVAKLAARK